MTEHAKHRSQKREMNWPAVLLYIHLVVLGAYGLWLVMIEAKWLTIFFALFITGLGTLGITSGAHRLWAHRSYQASWQIRLFLVLAHTIAGVGTIYDWVLAHRIHHKFYRTDKDPYNHNKGFWYSHIMGNIMTPHPDQEALEKDIDMRDLDLDGFVWIQRKFYFVFYLIFALLLPINAPAEYWGESLKNSVFILGFLRLALTVNISWLVNSAVLIWGLKPGDKFPIDDNSVFFVKKSYWPNYHYAVPWDWKSGEFGTYDSGCITFFIKMWYELGLVERMRTATSEDVREALHKMATSKKSTEDILFDLERIADEDAVKTKLHYYH